MSFTTFIQWKGTDLCMDFICPKCGGNNHFDGYYAYAIECPDCKAQFRMPSDVKVEEIERGSESSVLRSIDAEIEGP